MLQGAPITVVETPEFLSATRKLMDESDRADLVGFLALNPEAGDPIPGSGGVRKLRWALEGRGKRGGARVIYFFHDLSMPVYLLTAYAKNARENLTQAEIHSLHRIAKLLVESHRRRRLP
ncbi:MAG: type II toxin-antitoxin system RelE/ParE family toxin [Terracidiphilus sp.]